MPFIHASRFYAFSIESVKKYVPVYTMNDLTFLERLVQEELEINLAISKFVSAVNDHEIPENVQSNFNISET